MRRSNSPKSELGLPKGWEDQPSDRFGVKKLALAPKTTHRLGTRSTSRENMKTGGVVPSARDLREIAQPPERVPNVEQEP